MRRWLMVLLGSVLFATLSPVAGSTAPLDPALQQQLLDLYERYNKAIAAGKVDDALKTRSAATRKAMQKDLGSGQQRKEMLAFAASMIPDAIEVRHATIAKDGKSASILTIASKKIPADMKQVPGVPVPGSIARGELTLDFVKEGGAWKYDNQTFGMDPDKIVACTSIAYEPIEAYDDDRDLSLGGPIQRVDFNPDHTLVIVRVVEEEACAFMPDRATLEKAGLETAKLVPYAIIRIDGFPHRTDKQKVWIDRLSVDAEE
jgi:hypothetical protein